MLFKFLKRKKKPMTIEEAHRVVEEVNENFEKMRKKREECESTLEYKMREKLKNVSFFSGSKSEYEDMVGYEVEVIKLERNDKGVKFESHSRYVSCQEDEKTKVYLFVNDCEALINCQRVQNDWHDQFFGHYGLPVAKKSVD